MAWFLIEAEDWFKGDETEEERETWIGQFTQWVETTFDGRVSRLNMHVAGQGQPIPAKVISGLIDYWYENILSLRDDTR
jgi:hypothetical protein